MAQKCVCVFVHTHVCLLVACVCLSLSAALAEETGEKVEVEGGRWMGELLSTLCIHFCVK